MSEPSIAEVADSIVVERSARRKKTVSYTLDQGQIVLKIPARFSRRQESRARALVAEKVVALRSKSVRSDADLAQRAAQLNAKFLERRAEFRSIRWVSTMHTRWGSTTSATGEIRISDALRDVPGYVLDSVILHELVHTWVPDHGPEFQRWVRKTPKLERARGFLEAWATVLRRGG